MCVYARSNTVAKKRVLIFMKTSDSIKSHSIFQHSFKMFGLVIRFLTYQFDWEISSSKIDKAAEPNKLSISVFKDGVEVLTSKLIKLLRSIWAKENISKDWCQLGIVRINKRNGSYSCENYGGISL